MWQLYFHLPWHLAQWSLIPVSCGAAAASSILSNCSIATSHDNDLWFKFYAKVCFYDLHLFLKVSAVCSHLKYLTRRSAFVFSDNMQVKQFVSPYGVMSRHCWVLALLGPDIMEAIFIAYRAITLKILEQVIQQNDLQGNVPWDNMNQSH